MGRYSTSKSKNKSKGKKFPLNPTEEHARTQQSILQLFRARMQSSNKGDVPAEGPSTTSATSLHARHSHRHHTISIGLDSVHDAEETSSLRIKRRKTRSERNRLKHRSHNKTKTMVSGSTDKMDIRKADEMSSSKVNQSLKVKGVCALSSNRLTRKLGVFNQGKKSSAVARELIPVSGEVEASIEQTLREICHVDDCDQPPITNMDELDAQSICSTRSKHKQHTHDLMHLGPDSGPPQDSAPSAVTVQSTPKEVTAMEVDSLPVSPVQSIDSFPSSPALSETAEFLLSSLDVEQLFPGRNCLEETREDLRQIMEKSGPRDTDMFTTPFKTPLVRGGCVKPPSLVSSEVVNRKLEDSMPPTPPVRAHSAGRVHSTRLCSSCPRVGSATRDAPPGVTNPRHGAVCADALSLLRDNDRMINERRMMTDRATVLSQGTTHQKPDGLSILCGDDQAMAYHPDGLTILRANDRMMSSRNSLRLLREQDGESMFNRSGVLNLLHQSDPPSFLSGEDREIPSWRPPRHGRVRDSFPFLDAADNAPRQQEARDFSLHSQHHYQGLARMHRELPRHSMQEAPPRVESRDWCGYGCPAPCTHPVLPYGREADDGGHYHRKGVSCTAARGNDLGGVNNPGGVNDRHNSLHLDHFDINIKKPAVITQFVQGRDYMPGGFQGNFFSLQHDHHGDGQWNQPSHHLDILDYAEPPLAPYSTHQGALSTRQRLPLVRKSSAGSEGSPVWHVGLSSLPRKPLPMPSPPGPKAKLFRRRLY